MPVYLTWAPVVPDDVGDHEAQGPVEVANAQAALEVLSAWPDDVADEEGWVLVRVIREDGSLTEAASEALSMINAMADYPVLDEGRWSEIEDEHEQEAWAELSEEIKTGELQLRLPELGWVDLTIKPESELPEDWEDQLARAYVDITDAGGSSYHYTDQGWRERDRAGTAMALVYLGFHISTPEQGRQLESIHRAIPEELWAEKKRKANPSKVDPKLKVTGLASARRAMVHPAVVEQHERTLRKRRRYKRAVLVPCADDKPYYESRSHKYGYIPGLKGKKLDVWVVSEPMGVIPYEWAHKYPNESYDFPPKHVKGDVRDDLVERIAAWFKRHGTKYDRVYLALPGSHMKLVNAAVKGIPGLKLRDVSITACRLAKGCPPTHFRATSNAYVKYLRRTVK